MIKCKCSRSCSCRIPLKSVKVNTIIQNTLASVSIFQQFYNSGLNAIECYYRIPLNEESVITDVEIHLEDGTILTSTIMEKESAKERYQDGIAKGHTIALANQEKENQLNLLIGNLQPNESLNVEIHLTFPLLTETDS